MTTAKPNWRETIQYIRQDIRSYKNNAHTLWGQAIRNLYSHPSFAGVAYYRLGRWAWSARPSLFARILYFESRAFYPFVRLVSRLELGERAQIGPGLSFLRIGPTVIHPDPVAAGATIIGPVTIGDYVNNGAGAVVVRDIPDHTTAVGNPARPV